MADDHKNFAYSTVAVAPIPAASGSTLTLATGDGALMPVAPFNMTVWPSGVQPLQSNAEILRVSNVTGDVLTFARTQEGTGARSIVAGDQIAATITAKTLDDVETVEMTLSTNYVIPSGRALLVPSPYTIPTGQILTVSSGGKLKIF